MATPVFLSPTPILQFLNNAGQMNAGGSILTQVGGVNYPTYQDSAGNTPLPNPIPLNSRGEISNSSGISCQLFLSAGVIYTFTQYDVNGNQINQGSWVGSSSVQQNDYVNGNLGRVVDTIAGLRGLAHSAYIRCFVNGYYAVGDGGGGTYWYDPTDTTSADNGGTIIVASDGGRWKLAAQTNVTFQQFGARNDGGATDSTTAITNAFTWAATVKTGLNMSGSFGVTKVVIPNGVRHLMGDCTLIGQTSGSYSAVLEIKNVTDLTIEGSMLVSGNYNTGYSSGIKVWADQASGCSLLNFDNISVAGAKVGWQFGDPAQVDRLLSEIKVCGGYTYGCPIACQAYGTQTFVDFVGYTMESSYGAGTGAWLTLTARGVIAIAASITQTGGELLMTAITTGAGVELDPITSLAFTNNYGTYKADGVTIECASPFAVTGAAGVSSPVNGLLSFIGCTGIHTQNLQALIQTDASFTGKIICQSNNFYSTVARTFSNISCSGNAQVWCDDLSFGANFLGPLTGISGGILHFTKRAILRASNLAGLSLPTATQTDLKFTSLDNTGDLARFSSSYSVSTGVFTVPNGGLKSVDISTRIYFSTLTNIEIYIEVNNVIISIEPGAKGAGTIYNAGDLVAGTQIKATVNNIGGSVSVGSNAWDFLQITASN